MRRESSAACSWLSDAAARLGWRRNLTDLPYESGRRRRNGISNWRLLWEANSTKPLGEFLKRTQLLRFGQLAPIFFLISVYVNKELYCKINMLVQFSRFSLLYFSINAIHMDI